MKVGASLAKLVVFAVVTSMATLVIYFTIGNIRPGTDYTTYRAAFTDVTGLLAGDDVRVSGVQVGRITGAKVQGDHALVSFQLEKGVRLTTSATAQVRYKNLLGQRYVALMLSSDGRALSPKETLPIGQTKPALDLTLLFQGFKPLFKALSPADVNKLATEVVATLQGEGGTVDALLASTSSLTNTLAARDAAIGRVITNLNAVVGTVAERDQTLGLLIRELQRFTTGLAGDRDAIGSSISNIDALAAATARLLSESRPALDRDIADLNTVVATVQRKNPVLDEALRRLPAALNALLRAQSYGSWLNLYVCTLSVNTGSGPVAVPPNQAPEAGC
ncbi:MAG: phospholipid/cholesterol/gamma-HCH transport system substrate-binding protein [Frankiaceae bacterium]|nr:phospholipid/cholesterol/gamma-HCH transport system substrate-binding protein [Frankiaceae bacterium]